MIHIFQVGVGSGGMAALDLIASDPRIREITIVEPDVYKPHNVVRHLFPARGVGQKKVQLARQWLLERRGDLTIHCIDGDLCDPNIADSIDAAIARADLGVCAADNEAAKFHFNHLMLRHRKPWTLGEVLAGGIGGFVHCFTPDGPCYGCVASFLKRSVTTAEDRPVDYSQPGGGEHMSIPASKAAIAVIAGLHAQITLACLAPSPLGTPGGEGWGEGGVKPTRGQSADAAAARNSGPLTPSPSPPEYRGRGEMDFTSLLFPLEQVPGVFDEAYRPYKFRIPRGAACLICRSPETAGDLDRQLSDALDRLGRP
jgi:hypothetical protein